MRKFLGISAIALGVVGVIGCAATIGLAWWAAVEAVREVDHAAERLDQGLTEADAVLSRVEVRLGIVQTDLDRARVAAEKLDAAEQEHPRLKQEIERQLDQLFPTLDRAEDLAESLRTLAAGLRTSADISERFQRGDPEKIAHMRSIAGQLDSAAAELSGLHARAEQLKQAQSGRITQEIVALIRRALAGSERLASAMTSARREVSEVREKLGFWRNKVVFWIYASATGVTFLAVWMGLGQATLVSWGRQRLGSR